VNVVDLSQLRDRSSTLASAPQTSLRKVLILSPHFPPSTLAGVHRARHLAKHLPSHGWWPIIIRADEATYTEASDPALATLVPPSVEQIRTGAIPARFARLLGIGDIGLRAYHASSRAITAAVKQHKPEAIIITGSPFYPMLLSGRIAKTLGVPVILDFQDPWISETGGLRPRWSKGGLAHRLSLALEPRALRHAAWVTTVSDNHNDQLHRHHPWLSPWRMTAIPIGGDPEDFEAMRIRPPAHPAVRLDPSCINLCYVGTFLPRAGVVVQALFAAVARVAQDHPELGQRLKLVFVGTSNQPMGTAADSAAHRVTPLAEAAGIAHLVHEHPARVSFIEALHLQSNANGLLLLGSDEPHYTASKIYPAMMSGTPFLSVFHDRSSSHEILSRAGGGTTFGFADATQLDAMIPAIAEGLVKLAQSPDALGKVSPAAYAAYTAHAVAGKFADVLERATSEGPRPT
jgi:hypothetical protein